MVALPKGYKPQLSAPRAPRAYVPNGDYAAAIVESAEAVKRGDEKRPTDKQQVILTLTYEILEGEFAGTRLPRHLCIKHDDAKVESDSWDDFDETVLICLGDDVPDDTDALHNVPHVITVVNAKGWSNIRRIRDASTTAPVAEQAPATRRAWNR